MDAPDATPTRHQRATIREVPRSVGSNAETILHLKGERASEAGVWTFNCRCRLQALTGSEVRSGKRLADPPLRVQARAHAAYEENYECEPQERPT